MTNLEVYKVIHTWAKNVLGSGVNVIMAFQNAPQTQAPQVAISLPTSAPIGRATSGKFTVAVGGASGTHDVVTDYEGTVQMWETGGNGDLLRALVETLDLETIIEYFGNNDLAVDSDAQIVYLPRLDSASWVQEATCIFKVRFTSSVAETLGAIRETIVTPEIVS